MDLLNLIKAWGFFVSIIIPVFGIMEAVASQNLRMRLADGIIRVGTPTALTSIETPQPFVRIFDRVFGEKHLTPKCAWMSIIASLAAVAFLTILWALINPNAWQHFLEYSQEIIKTTSLGNIPTPWGLLSEVLSPGISAAIVFFALAAMLNLLPDYISLLETRLILNRVLHNPNKKQLFKVLILDAGFNAFIFAFFGVALSLFLMNLLLDANIGAVEFFIVIWRCLTFQTIGEIPFWILFYSTFFTSALLWLFMLANFLARLLFSLGLIGNRIIMSLKIEEYPICSSGIILIIFMTIILAVYMFIQTIFDFIF